MCPSSFDGGDAESVARFQVGVDADGVSHAREDGDSHAREDGDSLAREDGDSLARENGVSHARKDAVNVCSGVGHDGISSAPCARRRCMNVPRRGIDHDGRSGALCARRSGVKNR